MYLAKNSYYYQGRSGLPGLAGVPGQACTEDGAPPTGNG